MSDYTPELPAGLALMSVEDAASLKDGSQVLMYNEAQDTLKFWRAGEYEPWAHARCVVDEESDGTRYLWLDPTDPAKNVNCVWPVVGDGSPDALSTLLRYSVKT